jgi:CubicO group peptidase (beta-lactamase class C family)
LGLILEKVTGKPYAAALEERINSRIGLNDTYLATAPLDVSKGEAPTYLYTGTDWKLNFETHPSIARQLISTPGDMAKFIQALFDLKLITDSLRIHDLSQRRAGAEGGNLSTEVQSSSVSSGHLSRLIILSA